MAQKINIEPNEVSRNIQQTWFEFLGDRDWNYFQSCDYDALKKCIYIALFGIVNNGEKEKQKYVEKFLEKIIEYAGSSTIFMSVIYVVCEDLKKSEFKSHCIFRLKKYIVTQVDINKHIEEHINQYINCSRRLTLFQLEQINPQSETNKQKYEKLLRDEHEIKVNLNGINYLCAFIDENMRCYESWEDYLRNNTLPKCRMIVPRNGKYSGRILNIDEQTTEVLLDVYKSPACGLKKIILKTVDTASTVLGLGALGTSSIALLPAVTASAAAAPILPFIVAGSLIVGGITGTWSIIDNSVKIHDRRKHKESLSVTNAESRGLYLGIAAGITGIVATSGTKVISKLGQVSDVFKKAEDVTVKTANIARAFVNVCQVVNTVDFNKQCMAITEPEQWTSFFLFFQNISVPITSENMCVFNNDSIIENYIIYKKRCVFEKTLREHQLQECRHESEMEIIKGIFSIDNFILYSELRTPTNELWDDVYSPFIVNEISEEISNSGDNLISKCSQILLECDSKENELNLALIKSKIQSIAKSVKSFILSPIILEAMLYILKEYSPWIMMKILEIFEGLLKILPSHLETIEKICPFFSLPIFCLKVAIFFLQGDVKKLMELLPNYDFKECLTVILHEIINKLSLKQKIISKVVKYLNEKISTFIKNLMIEIKQQKFEVLV